MKCPNCGYIHKTEYMGYYENLLSRIKQSYDFTSAESDWKTASDIAKQVGIKKPTVKDARAVSSCIAIIYGKKKGYFRVSSGNRLIKIPPLIHK